MREICCENDTCGQYDEDYRGHCNMFRQYAIKCKFRKLPLFFIEDEYYAEMQL